MTELKVRIPDELESEFKALPNIEISLLVSNLLKNRLSRIVKFKRAVLKSKLTQSQADKLADEISTSLSQRYNRL